MPATQGNSQPDAALRLYINIDHVATIRQARRTDEPDPVEAALLCERAGADGITAHLREDRRHIQDDDVERLARAVKTVLNLEMATTDEMVEIALRLRPYQVTLVPERREEITTEGGLDVVRESARVESALKRLAAGKIRTSLFIAPDPAAVRRSREVGADAIELHTGPYAHAPHSRVPLEALRECAALGRELGLAVHAGHGLTVRNVGPVAAIAEIEELNIGHSIVSRSVFVGLAAAVREMRDAMNAARHD
ncbi:MAG TPA: pyridoxine 5'-phosphate synthase [Gemmatimonadaceae bacterium]|nr:pyridoxine 5'-phosphate synthase [Gemmatimonadaceae bacterium]